MRKVLFAIVVSAAFAVSATAQCSDADRKALEAFDHAWGAATTSGDRAALMNFYADEYTSLPNMQDKAASIDAAVKAAERARSNPNPDKVTYDHYIISCTPNTATITHRNTVRTADGTGGKPETFYTRSVHFLEKRNGKWQVVSNAGGALDDYGVIWYLEQDWNDAILHRNKDWAEKTFASDFVNVSPSGERSDRTASIADMVNSKSTLDAAETSDMNIRIDGNTAIVTGIFHTKGKNEKGEPVDRRERYTDVWIKRDGRWQAWSSHGSLIPDKAM